MWNLESTDYTTEYSFSLYLVSETEKGQRFSKSCLFG